MSRERLANRRRNVTLEFKFGGTRYAATVGYFPNGRVGEVFCHGAKVGSAMDAILDDISVLASLLLQHGVGPRARAPSLGRHSGGEPASIAGAVLDLLTGIAGEAAA